MAGDDFNYHNTCIRVALYNLLLKTGEEKMERLLDELAKIGAPFEWQAMTIPDLYENIPDIFTPSGSDKQVDAKMWAQCATRKVKILTTSGQIDGKDTRNLNNLLIQLNSELANSNADKKNEFVRVTRDTGLQDALKTLAKKSRDSGMGKEAEKLGMMSVGA